MRASVPVHSSMIPTTVHRVIIIGGGPIVVGRGGVDGDVEDGADGACHLQEGGMVTNSTIGSTITTSPSLPPRPRPLLANLTLSPNHPPPHSAAPSLFQIFAGSILT